MMNFRKIAAASKGTLILRYMTEDTPEPIHPPPVDSAGRQLEEGGRLTSYYTGRDSRATWRADMPALIAKAIGIDPRKMPRDREMTRLFEGRRGDNGQAWSAHKRKLSGFDLVFSPHKSVKLLEIQAKTGMTLKMLGDREQAQAIEAGDSIELLRRALPPEALPELLTTIRQTTRRGREIAGLFREGNAEDALRMKRADGHAMLVGGDRDQVVAQIADIYVARRDILFGSGSKRGITVSAPTNEDAADISIAIRKRLKERGEIGTDERRYEAVDQNGREYLLPLATGDRVRLFRRTWGDVGGRMKQVGNNGDVVELLAQSHLGIRIRTTEGEVADIEWRRFKDDRTGRVLLGFGHALTIDAAQGLTSDEHINALPRGTGGVTAFKSYVAESRSRGTTWTVISEGALLEAERHRQALGDITPITKKDLWDRAASDMSQKPYKALGIDLKAAALQDREKAIDTFISCHQIMERAQLADPKAGPKALQRLRAAAVNEHLGRYIEALTHSMAENTALISETVQGAETARHLRMTRNEAEATTKLLKSAGADEASRPSGGPSF